MADGFTTTLTDELTEPEREAILDLAGRAALVDGFQALNEAAHLQLRHPRRGVSHLLARHDEQLLGYGQLDPGESFSTGQLVVDPQHRRRGVGTTLIRELITKSAAPVQFWAVSNTAAAQALAARSGLRIGRELLIMRRSLTDPLPEVAVPAGIAIRTFVTGQDEEDWLAVNARAFRDHPEQGGISRDDLADRMAEPWFDPAGFLVAVRTTTMVGFHWTKQHQDHLGEVYVLGVDPSAGGQGLGKALLAAGLLHLQRRGNLEVELYVEADHERAVRLYQGYGFATASRDVMYVQP